jgi:hypothetical protein
VTVGFTPGPWETAEAFYKNGFYVLGEERGQGWVRQKRLDDCGAFQNEADARLIAAAPELYEACRDALALLNWDVITAEALNQVGHTLAAAINKADAA